MYRAISAVTVCFFLFILWILYLANTGSSSIFFNFVRSIPYGDKLGHVGLFGLLTLLAIVSSKFRSISYGRLNIYYGAAVVFLFALGEELSQAFIPSRTFDFVDLAADSIGILVAAGFAYLASKHYAAVVLRRLP